MIYHKLGDIVKIIGETSQIGFPTVRVEVLDGQGKGARFECAYSDLKAEGGLKAIEDAISEAGFIPYGYLGSVVNPIHDTDQRRIS